MKDNIFFPVCLSIAKVKYQSITYNVYVDKNNTDVPSLFPLQLLLSPARACEYAGGMDCQSTDFFFGQEDSSA